MTLINMGDKLTQEIIDSVTSIQEGVRWMRRLSISTDSKGQKPKSLQDIKNILTEHNGGARGDENTDLRSVWKTDEVNRKSLLKLFEESVQLFGQLPQDHRENLNSIFHGYQQDLQVKMEELKRGEYAIVIAGETGAGKTSLLNLLMRENFFPTSPLSCTATVCELRSSEDKYALLYEYDKKSPFKLDLSKESGRKKLVDCIQYQGDEDKRPYEQINVYWPFPAFEERMALVDLPGIGDNRDLTKVVHQYMKKAFGCIYVINSTNAGGVQKDRLEELLLSVVEAAGDTDFDPAAALFVCNKWDQIPSVERRTVSEHIFEKLSALYPGITEKQLVYLSALQVSRVSFHADSRGSSSKDISRLLTSISHLIPATLRSKLTDQYRWLSSLLKRALYRLKVSQQMDHISVEEAEQMLENLKRQIDIMDHDAEDTLVNLKNVIFKEAQEVRQSLTKVLSDPATLSRSVKWKDEDCPTGSSTKAITKSAVDMILNRLTKVINEWEQKNGIVNAIRDRVLKQFRRKFALMEDQMQKVEGILLKGHTRDVIGVVQSVKPEKSRREDEKLSLTLGRVISGLAGVSADSKDMKRLMKSYQKSATMSALVKIYIQKIISSENFEKELAHFFEKFTKQIDAVGKLIPKFLSADREMLKNLTKQKSANENRLAETPALIAACSKLQGHLGMFYVNTIKVFDITLPDFGSDVPFGTGSFANVYLSQLSVDGKLEKVALKVWRERLTTTNITDILLEDSILRSLSHRNVISYFGASIKKTSSLDFNWVMVMEFCKTTLKHRLVSDKSRNPGKCGHDEDEMMAAMMEMANFAGQIASGVYYLHEKGLLHRDLKPENILVTDRDVVKLTDVGLAKHLKDIAGTKCGSPCYMAPEILNGRVYGQEADIYSFAIILWEMWYGIDAAEHLSSQLYGSFEKSIDGGFRPSLSLKTPPIDEWRKIIVAAWNKDPSCRPTAESIMNFCDDFLHQTPAVDY